MSPVRADLAVRTALPPVGRGSKTGEKGVSQGALIPALEDFFLAESYARMILGDS